MEITDLYNLEAEQSIIGDILLDESNLSEAIRLGLKEQHFFDEYYSSIYRIMLFLIKNNKPVDIISVHAEGIKQGNDFKMSVLTDIVNNTVSLRSFKYYCDLVMDLFTRRILEESTRSLLIEVKSKDINLLKDEFEMLSLYCKGNTNISENIESVKGIIKKHSKPIKTNFDVIDKRLGGLNGGTLTIISGDSGVGKSSFINQVIANVIYDGNNCLLYSGELTNDNVSNWITRTISNESDIVKSETDTGSKYTVTDNAKFLIEEWLDNKLFLCKDDMKNDVNTVVNVIEYSAKIHSVRLAIIDNLMTISSNKPDKYERQEHIVAKLKECAKNNDIAIILVAHNKKNKEQNQSIYNISGASEIVNLADHIISLTRKDSLENGNSIENYAYLSITKNRTSGITISDYKLTFNRRRKRFYETFDNEMNFDYAYNNINGMPCKMKI
ncbi:MAG: DnaB-like helicase C-terminal domain-containing protein [Peptostreptococcus porci]|uniref:DnaB-like helicase C-terminal domain-containing protein n=2 Tax=Peptostreptococcus porci TaxID=2652282 RepID=UPI002A83F1A2|nr:DnaB-like helicase C-terminal domain-containing protein [Peptostreptococcus porci]MDY4127969.1 DnaB-like helicase C-terminal domain-containing protein [Peptostreptococcus porci]MDY4561806.1 DnaB-like helicase C-terminal domain-containing protein [Peptostreptococcus porci]